MKRLAGWLRGQLGIVKVRQLADRLRHRLSFVPGLYVIGSIVVAQCTLLLDRALSDQDVPEILATTVGSARSVFTAIAGGLITSITLLLSMMLVAVQLASSQFSPRTLRDWLGDRLLKNTVGIALGTTVFSLLALRSAREFGDEGGETVPHSSVIIAVLFGVISLFAVVRSVDHITQSLRIGSVARRIAGDTISVIDADDAVRAGQDPSRLPSPGDTSRVSDDDDDDVIPDDAAAIESPTTGWLQQIGTEEILDRLPEASTSFIVVPLGGFVTSGSPLIWVSPAPPDDDDCRVELLDAFAIGDTRTLQQDVAFGIVQLTDIAVRALSPGINDPSTATDVIVHLGDVLLRLWSKQPADRRVEREGRALIRRKPAHTEHLSRAFDPIRRYGRTDPDVLSSLVRTLQMIHSEVDRRGLPGPATPLTDMIETTLAHAETDGWSQYEIDEFERLCDARRR